LHTIATFSGKEPFIDMGVYRYGWWPRGIWVVTKKAIRPTGIWPTSLSGQQGYGPIAYQAIGLAIHSTQVYTVFPVQ